MAFSNILVPVAGNPVDEDAIRLAVQMARQDKAKVLVVHVIEVQRNLPLNSDNVEQMTHADTILEQTQQFAKEAKGSIEMDLLQARTAGSALVDEAVARGVDLIILGVPYRKPLGDFVLGSTTLYILKNARCRVWLCRELARDQKPAAQASR